MFARGNGKCDLLDGMDVLQDILHDFNQDCRADRRFEIVDVKEKKT